MAPSEYQRHGRYYRTWLKVALAVYAWEQYGVTVRDTLRERDVQRATASRSARERLRGLGALLDQLERCQHAGGGSLAEMTRLYDRAVEYLRIEGRFAVDGASEAGWQDTVRTGSIRPDGH